MRKETKEKHFIKKPYYEGGPKAMKQFLAKQLRYPPKALRHGTEGTVRVRYEIGVDGKVIDTRVLSSVGHGCDEEAQRIVKLLQFAMPNKLQKVKFYKTVSIHFRLPQQAQSAAQPTAQSYRYQLTPSAQKKKSYSYTIKIPPK